LTHTHSHWSLLLDAHALTLVAAPACPSLFSYDPEQFDACIEEYQSNNVIMVNEAETKIIFM
jgi:hypothetical protein